MLTNVDVADIDVQKYSTDSPSFNSALIQLLFSQAKPLLCFSTEEPARAVTRVGKPLNISAWQLYQ